MCVRGWHSQPCIARVHGCLIAWPPSLAASNGFEESVRVLLKGGADVDHRCSSTEFTAVQVAMKMGYPHLANQIYRHIDTGEDGALDPLQTSERQLARIQRWVKKYLMNAQNKKLQPTYLEIRMAASEYFLCVFEGKLWVRWFKRVSKQCIQALKADALDPSPLKPEVGGVLTSTHDFIRNAIGRSSSMVTPLTSLQNNSLDKKKLRRSASAPTVVTRLQTRDVDEALLEGVGSGNTATVIRLLDQSNASANACFVDGRSALHLASAAGHIDIVQKLLAHGASVESECAGSTPLIAAAENNRLEVLTCLLASKADPNQVESIAGMTAAIVAAVS